MIKDHIRQKNIFFEEKLNPVYQEIIKKEEAERKVEQEAKEAELRAQQENITQQIINQLNNF
jgi:protein involved in sex pheromone biosynthesis